MDQPNHKPRFLITKENAQHFRRLALEAKLRNKLARERHQAELEAIRKDPPREIEARLLVQAAALHSAILREIETETTSRFRAEKVRVWLDCQAKLLSQIRNSPEPSHGKRPGRRPEIAPIRPPGQMGNPGQEQPQPVQDAPFPARVEPEQGAGQEQPSPAQSPACPPLSVGDL